MKSRTCTPSPASRFDKDGRVLTSGDIVSIREAAVDAASARCPLCRGMLIARQGRRGPYFHCAGMKKAA